MQDRFKGLNMMRELDKKLLQEHKNRKSEKMLKVIKEIQHELYGSGYPDINKMRELCALITHKQE